MKPLLTIIMLLMTCQAQAAPKPECGLNPYSKGMSTRKDDLMAQIVVCFDSGRHVTLYRDKYPDIQVYCYGDAETEKEWRRRMVLERVAARRAEIAAGKQP